MTIVRRILDFVLVCLVAAVICAISFTLWPYFGLVAPAVVIVILVFAVSVVDGVWYTVLGRRPS